MPDTTLGKGFLSTAMKLIPEDLAQSPQADLRRAVSCCYYAVFHSLAKACADALVGSDLAEVSKNAWVEAYRGLDHGKCYSACQGATKVNFPDPLKKFSQEFMQLQEARHRADYDPKARIDCIGVLYFVGLAEECIQALDESSPKDMAAYATWMLITSKGAEHARRLVRDRIDKQIVAPVQA